MDTQNAAKLKQNLQKNDTFWKKKCDFFLRKKTLTVRFILKPAYSHVAGARDCFFARNRIPFTCFSFFFAAPLRTLPFRWRGGSCFFRNSQKPFLAANRPKLERGARARARRCCSGFRKIKSHALYGAFWKSLLAPKPRRAKRAHFIFLRNFAKFRKIGPEIFQKKSYYCIGFSGAKRGSTLNIWRGRTRGKIERAFRSRSSLRSLLRLLNLIYTHPADAGDTN